MKKLILILLATGLSFNLYSRGMNNGPRAGAGPAGPEAHPGMKERGLYLKLNQLNLSKKQQKEIEDYRVNSAGKISVTVEKIKILQEKLQAAIDKPKSKATTKELYNLNNQILKLREKFAKMMFEKRMKIREILTNEQIEQMRKLKSERGRWNKNHRNNGRMNRRPGEGRMY